MVNPSGKHHDPRYVLRDNRATRYIEWKLVKLKGEVKKILQSKLEILLPLSQKLIEQLDKKPLRIQKIWKILSTHFDLNDIHRTLQQISVDYTFSSSACETFIKIDYMRDHIICLNKLAE